MKKFTLALWARHTYHRAAMSIFLSIASYCDPVLGFTLERAIATARDPGGLHFGIVDQSPAAQALRTQAFDARVSYVRLDPVYARGPCWARAIAMSLYDGEDWFLQIDSHMDFDLHWDRRLTEEGQSLMEGRRGIAITAYPNPFVFEADRPVHKPATDKVLAHVVKTGANFEAGHPVLAFEAHPVDRDEPLEGFHVAAGCLFAPGNIVQALPYDPWFYFHGEEQAYAARLYTHGWDIFHIPALPLYHLYNNAESGAPARPLHWDDSQDRGRPRNWWHLEERSRARLEALLAGEDLGAYGLGKVRSMAEYAAFSGIDFAARSIAPRAYRPLERLEGQAG
jgi:hypothetical protein